MAIKTFSSGEILTASDTNTYLNNGGLVYVAGTSATTGTVLDITSCFSATYDSYRVIISDYRTASSANLSIQLLSGVTPDTTNYAWAFWRVAYDATYNATASGYPAYVSSWAAQATAGSPAGDATAMAFDLYNPYLAQYSFLSIQSHDSRIINGYGLISGGGVHATESSYTGIRFTSSQTYSNINVVVYGYRKP